MKTARVKINIGKPAAFPAGRIDAARLDGMTEEDLARQQQEDDRQAMQDMAKYARHVRRRLGLTQQEFARRIDVSLETIRNWEQGRRCPTGAAKALLKVLDKAPEACLEALA
ncbi:MAG: helix-turn-helix domain-containing protein [Candidimonas sp.]|nr:MAG: helix-turn-helix domain-containing protein [Candidimonas sp.]TAM76196.1 MAG: helix-turn-helix domain-containing protein [Candidimonas sp.]